MTQQTKKVSVNELRTMVKEAVALQLDKHKKQSAAEQRKQAEKNKEKASVKEGVTKITVEDLRAMVKEAVVARLKENHLSWGPEDTTAVEQDPMFDEPGKDLNQIMGTTPGQDDRIKTEIEHLETLLGRSFLSRDTIVALEKRIAELSGMLGQSPGGVVV